MHPPGRGNARERDLRIFQPQEFSPEKTIECRLPFPHGEGRDHTPSLDVAVMRDLMSSAGVES